MKWPLLLILSICCLPAFGENAVTREIKRYVHDGKAMALENGVDQGARGALQIDDRSGLKPAVLPPAIMCIIAALVILKVFICSAHSMTPDAAAPVSG